MKLRKRFPQLSNEGKIEGKITGPIVIDENGRRQSFQVQIMDVRPEDSVQTAYWLPDGLHSVDSEEGRDNYLYKSIEQKKFKISTKLVNTFPDIFTYSHC